MAASAEEEANKAYNHAIQKYIKTVRYLDAVDTTPETTKELPAGFAKGYYPLKISTLLNLSLVRLHV